MEGLKIQHINIYGNKIKQFSRNTMLHFTTQAFGGSIN